ncbi:MAG: hypothetical protein IT461_02620 [Planctomycetes bacterium]|nr:hypothetical protein [Planctomycetota bacterium]
MAKVPANAPECEAGKKVGDVHADHNWFADVRTCVSEHVLAFAKPVRSLVKRHLGDKHVKQPALRGLHARQRRHEQSDSPALLRNLVEKVVPCAGADDKFKQVPRVDLQQCREFAEVAECWQAKLQEARCVATFCGVFWRAAKMFELVEVEPGGRNTRNWLLAPFATPRQTLATIPTVVWR